MSKAGGSISRTTWTKMINKPWCHVCISHNTMPDFHSPGSWKTPVGRRHCCWVFQSEVPWSSIILESRQTSSQPLSSILCNYSITAKRKKYKINGPFKQIRAHYFPLLLTWQLNKTFWPVWLFLKWLTLFCRNNVSFIFSWPKNKPWAVVVTLWVYTGAVTGWQKHSTLLHWIQSRSWNMLFTKIGKSFYSESREAMCQVDTWQP